MQVVFLLSIVFVELAVWMKTKLKIYMQIPPLICSIVFMKNINVHVHVPLLFGSVFSCLSRFSTFISVLDSALLFLFLFLFNYKLSRLLTGFLHVLVFADSFLTL